MAERIVKTCLFCGKEYSIRAHLALRSNYCGVPCRDAARRVPVSERFWTRVQKGGADDCWPWVGSKRGAYGCIRADGVTKSAHRIAYELSIGPIPDGMEVMHSCDNPPCCNPAHLSAGTHGNNMQDMRNKVRGSGQVLGPGDVDKVRAMYFEQHIPQRRIARELGLSVSAVSKAMRGQNWAQAGTPGDDVLKAAAAMTRSVNRGNSTRSAKLTPEIVRAMRAEHMAGSKQVDIAAKYGVSKMATSKAIRGKSWAHVE